MGNSNFNYTCPSEGSLEETQTELFVGNLTFYHFNLILSGAAMAICCLVSFSAIILHATHLSKPGEQLKIIRIAMFIPFYAIYSYLILALPSAQTYLLPWRDFVESIALATFFILLCEYIHPSDDEREVFFAGLELPRKKDGSANTQDPLTWYRRKWITVFQFPIVSLLVALITDITEAANRYCLTSFNIHFAHLWMVIIINVSLSVCIASIFIFYKALKPQLSAQRPLAKFFAFKGIIGITFLVNILFAILNGAGALKTTSHLNHADLAVGIPTLIVLLFLVPFSVFFHYAYTYRPYIIREGMYMAAANTSNSNKPTDNESHDPLALATFTPKYQGGPLGCRAYIYAISPLDVLRGIRFAFTLFSEEARTRAANGGSGRGSERRQEVRGGRGGGLLARFAGGNTSASPQLAHGSHEYYQMDSPRQGQGQGQGQGYISQPPQAVHTYTATPPYNGMGQNYPQGHRLDYGNGIDYDAGSHAGHGASGVQNIQHSGVIRY